MPPHSPADAARALHDMSTRWRTSELGERQAFHSWFVEFCDALGVARPAPDESGAYCFGQSLRMASGENVETTDYSSPGEGTRC